MRTTVPQGENAVAYVSTRLGCSRLVESRTESYQAVFYNNSGITPREREVIRIRGVAELECQICGTMRAARDLPGYCDEEIPESVYTNVLDKSWPGYTDRERLIIEFTELYLLDFHAMSSNDAFLERLRTLFSDDEIADLCILAAHWECSMKLSRLFLGPTNICEVPVGEKPAGERLAESGFARQIA